MSLNIKKRLGDNVYPIVIVIVAMIVVGIIAVVVYKNRDKVEAQRTAKIVAISGPCVVMREGARINAVVDMPLYSGDTFYSGIDASARIMIDDDKFLYLDSTTQINFTASGTPDETHTLIYVETGSMLTEVKEKLADGESFDIVTPNSFMEIHGTKTLTQVTQDANGNVRTSSAVLQGAVDFTAVVKSGGKTLSVGVPMTAGESRLVGTEAAALVGEDEMKQIAETGKCTDGESPTPVTYEEAGIVTGKGEFSEKLLDDVTAVLQISELEDIAVGGARSDSDGNGLADSIDNVNLLRANPVEVGSVDDVPPAKLEEILTDQPLPVSPEDPGLQEDDLQIPAVTAPAGDNAAAGLTEQEIQALQIQAIEQAMAQVAANNQALAEEAARQAQEAENQQQNDSAGQTVSNDPSPSVSDNPGPNTSRDDPGPDVVTPGPDVEDTNPDEITPGPDSDVHSSDTPVEEEVDPVNGGTFSGKYASNGYPLYVRNGEYYYLTEQSEEGIVWYEGDLLDAPPSTT